jgi:hypothetical protein
LTFKNYLKTGSYSESAGRRRASRAYGAKRARPRYTEVAHHVRQLAEIDKEPLGSQAPVARDRVQRLRRRPSRSPLCSAPGATALPSMTAARRLHR